MPSDTCNRIRVERYYLEEAPAPELVETARHLESCPRCKEQLDALVHERQAYLAARPFSRFAAERLERKARPSWLAMPRAVPVLAGALATLALVAVIQLPRSGGDVAGIPELASDGLRAKGGVTFDFHFRRDGKVAPGSLSEDYRAGDELQFVYSAGSHAHVALVSVDAQGTVSLYRREVEPSTASIPAEAGRLASFPFSVTLDDAAGGELFVLLMGSEPMAAAEVESWLSKAYDAAGGDLLRLAGSLEAPAPAREVKTLLLKKAAT